MTANSSVVAEDFRHSSLVSRHSSIAPLLSAAEFRAMVSGERRGLRAAALRAALRAAETPYTLAVRWRNRGYDRGQARSNAAGVPVVSVGNLTLGGTGKTPLVAWIARWLRRPRRARHDHQPRLWRRAGAPNDEALELEQKLPDVPHLQNPDRVAAARTAVEEFDCQVILLDDGFQHRRLARDLDIVLLDALEPFGFGHVFPRGMLREPISGLQRANIVVLSRADMITLDKRLWVRREVERDAPHAAWVEVRHAPERWLSSSGSEQPVDAMSGQRLAAFCGLGNPSGFRHTLAELRLLLQAFREFPDHHLYDRQDVESLVEWAAKLDVAAVACTHKDLVKLELERLGDRPLWALVIGIEVLAGQHELEQQLTTLLPWTEASEKKEATAEDAEERGG